MAIDPCWEVNFIFLDPAVPAIFHFKHDVEAFLTIIFIANPDVDYISNAIVVLFYGYAALG